MTVHCHIRLLFFKSYWKEKISIECELARVLSCFRSHKTCVGCFGETPCAPITSSGEHQQLKQMLTEEWPLVISRTVEQFGAAYGKTWYWARTHDMPAMIRFLDHWATAAHYKAARGFLVTDLVMLNLGQVTKATPEMASFSSNSNSNGRALSLDIFNVYRPPSTRWVFIGTRTRTRDTPAASS
ncbi:hypothetical protein TNCV_3370431 [Trichonephila clavipes]|nr:hypothetical protein TNCV_3370431 [Trichonephila clavipes]